MVLDYLALGFMIFAVIVLFYAIIAIHDIPYEIAKKRGHPHSEAIHYAGWVSKFTLHAIWPFLWIWATIYNADRGYGFAGGGREQLAIAGRLDRFESRLAALETPRTKPASTTTAKDKPAYGRIGVLIKLEEDISKYQLPAGVAAEVAVYTEHVHHVAMIRRILFRMKSWQNYLFGEGH